MTEKYILSTKGKRINKYMLEQTGEIWVEINHGIKPTPTFHESNQDITSFKYFQRQMEAKEVF